MWTATTLSEASSIPPPRGFLELLDLDKDSLRRLIRRQRAQGTAKQGPLGLQNPGTVN